MPDGRDDVLDVLVHQNARQSEVIVTDILDSDHLWTLLERREALGPVENLTDRELLQSLASEVISPNIQIHCSNEANKAAQDFAASTALAYSLSTRKTIILDWKKERNTCLDRL
jgi:hypothetical protein